MVKVTISLSMDVLKELDEIVQEKGYEDRSELVESLVLEALMRRKEAGVY